MVLRAWEDFPEIMKTSEVKEYYDILIKRKNSLRLKRGSVSGGEYRTFEGD